MTVSTFDEPAGKEPSRAVVLAKADETGLSTKLSEVTVFAIPLFHQGDLVQLVYLPVAAKEAPNEPSKSYVPQKLRDYASNSQVKFTGMWQQWGQKPKGMRRKVHDLGQRQVENVSPESRLLTGIKRSTKQLTVYHPSSISDALINQQMAAIASSHGKAEYWKLSAACCALPVALTVDTLVLIGLPPMLTGYTGYLSYKHYKGAAGATALKKLGQAPPSTSPLSAGLANLERMSQSQSQQSQQQSAQQQQQQPLQQSEQHPSDSSNTAYSGFAPQAIGPSTAYSGPEGSSTGQGISPGQSLPGDAPHAAQDPQTGQGSYTEQPLPGSAPQGYTGSPGGSGPAANQPQSYGNMLGSLPSAGPVHYPNIQSSGPPQGVGQNPNATAGYPSHTAGGAAPAQTSSQAITVGMEFIAVPALDDFVIRVAQRPDGALSEEDILELCAAIDAPELEKPLLELKQRQLRLASKPKK